MFFILNYKFQNNIKFDYYFFDSEKNKKFSRVIGKLDTSIFRASLMNGHSVIITHQYEEDASSGDEELYKLSQNQIYLSFRAKNLLPVTIEFHEFSSLLTELGNFRAKNYKT